MGKLDAQHFLGIYQLKQRMQEEGITNPPEEIKVFTRTLVEKLSKLPPDEEIILENGTFKDARGNIIAVLPGYPKE